MLSSKMADTQTIRFSQDDNITQVLKTMLFFTILMITMPIGLYFFSKSVIFEGMMGMTNLNSYFYAAIVAIFAVHVVLAMFIYVAWTEGTPPKPVKAD